MRCSTCGGELTSGRCDRCENRVVFRIVRKELLLLVLLSLATIPIFLFTRSMAARNRAMNVRTAGLWYERGQQLLQQGHTSEAIDALRNATTNDHDNHAYTLALANALGIAGHLSEAQQALLQLRAAAPENAGINLNLARLSAKEGETVEAVHYYRNALYGVWPADEMNAQRTRTRTELVLFLLGAGQTNQALSELLILSSDIPDTVSAHDSVGGLFLRAGDSQHALEQFTRALHLNSRDLEALGGAGQASFNLASYAAARRYLEAAIANGGISDKSAELLETTKLVLTRDPLAPGMPTAERIRRLWEDLSFVSAQLQGCLNKQPNDQKSQETLMLLQANLDELMKSQLRLADLRRDAEGFRAGLSIIEKIAEATAQTCGNSSTLQRALILIAKEHGASEQ